MVKLIITKFWPIFIPLIIYLIWLYIKKKQEEKSGNADKIKFGYGPTKLVVAATLIIALLCLILAIFVSISDNETYIRPSFNGDKLNPGFVEK